MSDSKSRNTYRRKETWFTRIYHFLMVMIAIEFIFEETINIQRKNPESSWHGYWYVEVVKLTKLMFLIVLLTTSALTLLYLMWSRYNYEFHK